ncbi:hypothetical protein [Streptomyces albipurpureus]|uniref:Uncharacterized protein n=1 Tax=Streptomyces albipurpureus TaxID=2897419 RepID=A0ABT0UZ07_9ACTN|nr:hypothetical protein [Streptomyces sp. CWNU-1]MCM2393204.1 hypothetical protein [Streptomyces sp. CWNU-1]
MSDLIPGPGGPPYPARGTDAAGLDDPNRAERPSHGAPEGTADEDPALLDEQPAAAPDQTRHQRSPTEPATPSPLGVPRAPTGNESMDALLERLADADHLPASGHLEVYEDVHRGLREALTALDARSGPVSAPGPQVPSDNYRS